MRLRGGGLIVSEPCSSSCVRPLLLPTSSDGSETRTPTAMVLEALSANTPPAERLDSLNRGGGGKDEGGQEGGGCGQGGGRASAIGLGGGAGWMVSEPRSDSWVCPPPLHTTSDGRETLVLASITLVDDTLMLPMLDAMLVVELNCGGGGGIGGEGGGAGGGMGGGGRGGAAGRGG